MIVALAVTVTTFVLVLLQPAEFVVVNVNVKVAAQQGAITLILEPVDEPEMAAPPQ